MNSAWTLRLDRHGEDDGEGGVGDGGDGVVGDGDGGVGDSVVGECGGVVGDVLLVLTSHRLFCKILNTGITKKLPNFWQST